MRFAHLPRILAISTCWLVVILTLVACGGGDSNTMLTRPSVPPDLSLALVQVPDLTGMTPAAAHQELLALGLNGEGEHVPVLYGWEGLPVIEQDPEAGTWVRLFSTVHYSFASPGTYMPDVVGLSEADAFAVLNVPGSNLQIGFVYSATPLSDYWGIVMAQSPAPGVLWPNEPPVTLVVGQAHQSLTTISVPPDAQYRPTTTTTIQQHRAP